MAFERHLLQNICCLSFVFGQICKYFRFKRVYFSLKCVSGHHKNPSSVSSLPFSGSRKALTVKTRDIHFRGLAIISLDWYRVVWHYPLSPSFALLRLSFSFQQRQWPFYPAVLSKCQVLSTLLLIYSPKRSRGSGVDIHPAGSVRVGAAWYNSSRVTGLSFCPCSWFIRSLVGCQTSLF